jgi:hypothetical protein
MRRTSLSSPVPSFLPLILILIVGILILQTNVFHIFILLILKDTSTCNPRTQALLALPHTLNFLSVCLVGLRFCHARQWWWTHRTFDAAQCLEPALQIAPLQRFSLALALHTLEIACCVAHKEVFLANGSVCITVVNNDCLAAATAQVLSIHGAPGRVGGLVDTPAFAKRGVDHGGRGWKSDDAVVAEDVVG